MDSLELSGSSEAGGPALTTQGPFLGGLHGLRMLSTSSEWYSGPFYKASLAKRWGPANVDKCSVFMD